MAVAFHPDEEYVALRIRTARFISSRGKLAQKSIAEMQSCRPDEMRASPARKLESVIFRHPFLDRESSASSPTTSHGTRHGRGAHRACARRGRLRHRREIQTGYALAGGRRGHPARGPARIRRQEVFDANPPIVELLKTRGVLLHTEKIEHSYPHCWRCHNPVIFRATEQWFISMETPMTGDGTLALSAARRNQKVKWDPAWGEDRISNMIATRPDWCISRQRIWGVPIAVFLCEKCGKPLKDKAINRQVVELFTQRRRGRLVHPRGRRIWSPPEPSVRIAGHEVQAKRWTSSMSGSSPAQAISPCSATNPSFPGPLTCTSRAAISIAAGSTLPCSARWARRIRAVQASSQRPAGHSTSKGRRCRSRLAMTSIQSISRTPRRRNRAPMGRLRRLPRRRRRLRTPDAARRGKLPQDPQQPFRYILGNLYDFDPARDAVPFEKLEAIDQYMLRQTAEIASQVSGGTRSLPSTKSISG